MFFVQPLLLIGLAAALLPVWLHLWLRPRPRRMRFPAIRLLQNAVRSGQRARRLQNVFLLILRASLLALLAILLAGPTCRPSGSQLGHTGSFACVLLLDDSASTRYRGPAGDWLEISKRQARRLLRDMSNAPQGARFALLRAGAAQDDAQWSDNAAALLPLIDAETPPHARPLGAPLAQAAELLRRSDLADQRLYVFTDGAASAWRDVDAALFAGAPSSTVHVRLPSAEPRNNLTLTHVGVPQRRVPVDVPTQATVRAAAADVTSEATLEIGVDLEERQVLPGLWLAPDDPAAAEVTVPPLSAGPHTLHARLSPSDRLPFDQERWAAFEAAPRPRVLLLDNPARSELDLSLLILRALLRPAMLPEPQQRVELEVEPPEDLLTEYAGSTSAAAAPLAMIVVPSGVPLRPPETEAILAHVDQGAVLLLTPSAASSDAVDWPGLLPLISSKPAELETLPALTRLEWRTARPSAAAPELERVGVRRRVRLGAVVESAHSIAQYRDGLPAIVQRPFGRGQIYLLTTSPAPDWSELGVRAAGLLTWLHELIDEAVGPPQAVAELFVGEVDRRGFAALPADGHVQVRRRAAPGQVWSIQLTKGAPARPWPAERPGAYEISAPGNLKTVVVYVVNWPAAESDLAPIDIDALRPLLGSEALTMTDEPSEARAAGGAVRALLDSVSLSRVVAFLLLASFLAELWFSQKHGRGGLKKMPQ